jgi:hypothetical protein
MVVPSLMKTCQSYQNNQTYSYHYNNVTQPWLFQKEDYTKNTVNYQIIQQQYVSHPNGSIPTKSNFLQVPI